jgi:peptidoglycan/xylan/chitin deacetylase (PgdA/CDA1 family)
LAFSFQTSSKKISFLKRPEAYLYNYHFMKNLLLVFASLLILTACTESEGTPKHKSAIPSKTNSDSSLKNEAPKMADAATIMSRKQVPILCYHHIRDLKMVGKASKGYEVTVAQFKAQMKVLVDSGYKTITPEEYYNYLTKGTALPEKPVMLTYDDTDEEQFSIAKPEMDRYGFKGVYFIMTISIGRPNYMTREQIRQLSDEGHVIGSHTWDHSRVDKYKTENTIEERGVKKQVNDWDQQFVKTKKLLEEITGKPVEYFAYPFGIWKKDGLAEIEKRGYKMAFQLSTKRDSLQPLMTARRMIVSPEWSAQGMIKVMKNTFK